jgi:hypothetical protein
MMQSDVMGMSDLRVFDAISFDEDECANVNTYIGNEMQLTTQIRMWTAIRHIESNEGWIEDRSIHTEKGYQKMRKRFQDYVPMGESQLITLPELMKALRDAPHPTSFIVHASKVLDYCKEKLYDYIITRQEVLAWCHPVDLDPDSFKAKFWTLFGKRTNYHLIEYAITIDMTMTRELRRNILQEQEREEKRRHERSANSAYYSHSRSRSLINESDEITSLSTGGRLRAMSVSSGPTIPSGLALAPSHVRQISTSLQKLEPKYVVVASNHSRSASESGSVSDVITTTNGKKKKKPSSTSSSSTATKPKKTKKEKQQKEEKEKEKARIPTTFSLPRRVKSGSHQHRQSLPPLPATPPPQHHNGSGKGKHEEDGDDASSGDGISNSSSSGSSRRSLRLADTGVL